MRTRNIGESNGNRPLVGACKAVSVIAIGMAFFVAAPVLAQQGAPQAPATSASKTPAQEAPAMGAAGVVVAVDQKTRSLTLQLQGGGEQRFQVDEKTRIMKAGSPQGSFSDLEVKQGIVVAYVEQDGRKIAKSISVLPAGRQLTAQAMGRVVSVDLKLQSLKIRLETGEEAVYRVGPQTQVQEFGKRKSLEDLKTGQTVRVVFTEQNGERLATHVMLTRSGGTPRFATPTPPPATGVR